MAYGLPNDKILLYNIDLDKNIELGGGEFVLTEVNWGTPNGAHITSDYMSRVGKIVTNSSIGARDIYFIGWVYVKDGNVNTMKRFKRELSNFINPLNEIIAFADGYRINFRPLNTIQFSQSYRENNAILNKFVIKGTCEDPTFKYDTDGNVTMSIYKKMFHVPFVVGTGVGNYAPQIIISYRETNISVAIVNDGDIACGMTVEFISTGSVLNPKLLNMNTGEYIRIEKELANGERILVDTSDKNMRVQLWQNGEYVEGFQYFDLNSTFMQLPLGESLFRYDAEENVEQLSVNILYSPRFLEVY